MVSINTEVKVNSAMTAFVTFILLVLGLWTGADSSNNNQCCYLYASVPANDSVCAIDGRPLALTCYVLNPHSTITNFTVRWYRSNDVTRSTSSTEELTSNQNEYTLMEDPAESAVERINCSAGPLYRDQYSLYIYSFTSHKNGYYWCQIVVNNAVLKPSQHVRIYAADTSSCIRPVMPFVFMGEPQCAVFSNNTSLSPTAADYYTSSSFDEVSFTYSYTLPHTSIATSVAISTTSTYYTSSLFYTPEVSYTFSNTLPHASLVAIPTTTTYSLFVESSTFSKTPHTSVVSSMSTPSTITIHTSTTQSPGVNQIAYVAGFLGVFIALLVSLVIVLLLLFICKGRRAKRQQLKERGGSRNTESNAIRRGSQSETLFTINNTPTIQQQTITEEIAEEDGIYSAVDDGPALGTTSLGHAQVDHMYDTPGMQNQAERNGQPRIQIYNTLTRVNSSTTTTIGDAHNRSKLYDLVGEADETASGQCGRSTLDGYDQVVLNKDTTNQQKAQRDHNNAYEMAPQACKMIPQEYEVVVYQTEAAENNKESSDDLGMFDDNKYQTGLVHKPSDNDTLFDDDVYLTRKAAATPGKVNYETVSENNTYTQSHNKSQSMTYYESAEYAEPTVVNIQQGQSGSDDEGRHYYHSLDQGEGENDSNLGSATNQKSFLEKSDVFGQSQKKQTDMKHLQHDPSGAAAVKPGHILQVDKPVPHGRHIRADKEGGTNTQHQLFDDSMYEGVSYDGDSHTNKATLIQHKPLEHDGQDTQPSGGEGSSMADTQDIEIDEDKDTEDFTDAPDYSDPLDSASVDDGASDTHREVEDAKVTIYGLFDDPTYA